MPAELISGKLISAQIYENLKSRIENLKTKFDTVAGLAVILVGDNPASQVYVKMKSKMCDQLGLTSEEFRLSSSITQNELIGIIESLNSNPNIDGILVQLPLPKHINEEEIIYAISPDKDVDGFHPVNVGKLLIGNPKFIPCTPFGVWVLLNNSGHSVEGKHVVIVGRSNIVGKPLMAMLCQKHKNANATVTICHSRTPNLPDITRMGDILIVAMGVPEFIKKDMVKPGAVVIDVGINRIPDESSSTGYRIVGDAAYNELSEIASAITPVPGGVGPMTIAMLMHNTVLSCELKKGIKSNPII